MAQGDLLAVAIAAVGALVVPVWPQDVLAHGFDQCCVAGVVGS